MSPCMKKLLAIAFFLSLFWASKIYFKKERYTTRLNICISGPQSLMHTKTTSHNPRGQGHLSYIFNTTLTPQEVRGPKE